MVKQYVFLVHGMGVHEADQWAEPFIESIITALKYYSPYNVQSDDAVRGQFEFVPINYDWVFEGYRQRWHQNSASVSDQLILLNPGVGDVFEWLAGLDDPGSAAEKFFWTHLLDPLLWYGFKEARCAVIAHVNEQIVHGLHRMEMDVGGNNCHIIAHSQGTSVIHDALVSLTRFPVFDPSVHRWNTIAMVANVSRLLHNLYDIDSVSAGGMESTSVNLSRDSYKPHSSVLKPGDVNSICDVFLNFHHRIDPFTWPKRFKPDGWPDDAYLDVEIEHYGPLSQVHDFEHYMANPAVHLPIFQSLTSNPMLGLVEGDDVKQQFELDYPNTAPPDMSALRDIFDNDPDKDLDIKTIATFLYKAFNEISQ